MTVRLGERVKIVATIGPKSQDPKVLQAMLLEGADAIRINASHAEPDSIKGWVNKIRAAGRAVDCDVAVLLDLQGIKRRIADLPEPMRLEESTTVELGRRKAGRIPVQARTLKAILPYLTPGSDVFLDDGFLRLQVLSVAEDHVTCTVVRGGRLKSRAGINLPGQTTTARIPTRRDKEHIAAGLEAGVDLFAVSFVRDGKDLDRTRKLTGDVPLVAKIELPEAVRRIEEICAASNGILVARGDLAVEMRPEELPVLQKSLVATANRMRVPVIVATEMLASMVEAPRPTRAELTDVGNAVLDGTDATMLSDETAIGWDPPRAVRYMARIIQTVERSLLNYDLDVVRPHGDAGQRADWAIADAAVETAAKIDAAAIVAMTGSGRTARLISANRPSVPLYVFAADQQVRRRVALMWGVAAETIRPVRDHERLIRTALDRLVKSGQLERGDEVVVVFGSPVWEKGTKTNTVRVERV